MTKIKARKAMHDSLYEQYRRGVGTPKTGKDEHNATNGTIHSNVTFRTYDRLCSQYADWLRDDLGVNTPEAARNHVEDYLYNLIEKGYSAHTVATAACAICKALRIRTTDLEHIKLPTRYRDNITRSREAVERDKHFSATRNAPLVTFCQSFGLRRHELEALRGSSCTIDREAETITLHVIGKGGKYRDVTFYGSQDEYKICARLIDQAADGKVFPRVHSACDVHYYRSIYAGRVYAASARSEIPKKDRYHCRGDKRGEVYDKQALAEVSRQLGHNRLDVVINNYSHNF